jgi:hypothetical protein
MLNFNFIVCLSGDSNTHFLFIVAEYQLDDQNIELIDEVAALNGCVRIEWE